jgi:hypothetical protein
LSTHSLEEEKLAKEEKTHPSSAAPDLIAHNASITGRVVAKPRF